MADMPVTRNGTKRKLVIPLLVLLLLFCAVGVVGAQNYTYGDLDNNGVIDVRDVLLAMKYVLGYQSLTEAQLEAADVNGDGVVNISDVNRRGDAGH